MGLEYEPHEPQLSGSVSGLKRLSISTIISIYILMLIGSYTSKIGAGLACPEWPQCPVSADPLVLVEFAHRVWSIATLIILAATVYAALKLKGGGSQAIRRAALLLLLTFLAQVFWGAAVIFTRLEPLTTTVHLGLATLVFGEAVYLAGLASTLKQK